MKQSTGLMHGDVLSGRYAIDRIIGEGGMSRVYLAEDLKLSGKRWAVKESRRPDEPEQRMAAEEARLLIRLSHPRLPRIVDYFESEGTGLTYLVMDYIEGETLEKFFRRRRGNVAPDFIRSMAEQLLDVLEYLHSHDPQVIFRDLKPSNIMLTEQLEVRLIDFGVARSYRQDSGEDTVKLGTVGFAAPEQFGGRQSDARSDLYGLGALLLYLSTGGRFSEWIAGVDRYIKGDLPREMVPVIRKLLQYSPEQRYQTASEVREALGRRGVSVFVPAAKPDRLAGTLVAAVLGASPGVGSTHTSIALAFFLATKRDKVAVVEMGAGAAAFSRIQEIAEGERSGSVRKFELGGIDFWRQTSRGEVISLLGGTYDAVVLDLGSYRDSERLEEFLRADLPLVVGSGAEWRQHDVLTLSRMLSRHTQPHRAYALPLAGADAVQRMRRVLGTDNVYSLPLHLDPFEITEESERVFARICRDFLPVREAKRRFRFRKN